MGSWETVNQNYVRRGQGRCDGLAELQHASVVALWLHDGWQQVEHDLIRRPKQMGSVEQREEDAWEQRRPSNDNDVLALMAVKHSSSQIQSFEHKRSNLKPTINEVI